MNKKQFEKISEIISEFVIKNIGESEREQEMAFNLVNKIADVIDRFK